MVGQTIGSGTYRFEIEGELGSGAMGTVYRAKFHRGEKVVPVALKVVALGLLGNEGAMARFEREASILKQLRHPHIVKLYATGHYKKTPFIAMEFIDGEALDRVLARRGRLTWEEIVAYGKQLCEALQYAHEKGIIHRDLKPSNLMITREGTLKLTDFGIAKDTDVTALTGMNSTIGTAAYMSPEQCKGDKNLTPKSDLYSLGVVFFELLTGRKPFTADTTVEMFLKHVNEPPARVGKLVTDLPVKFEALVLQLLAKNKEERPVDAAWVGRMLAEIEDDAFARKSAGLDAATARRGDRPRNLAEKQIDDADREAARLLKGRKKKKRQKRVVWYKRPWLKAAGIVALLLLMAAGVWYFAFRSDPPEKLAAAIDSAPTAAAKLEAAERYLKVYHGRPGELTDKAAAVYRDGKAREREGQLQKRFGFPKWRDDPEGDDPAAYHDAMSAIQAEKDGNLKLAADFWTRVKGRFPEEAKVNYTTDEGTLAKARWSWVADKRLRDIQAVGETLTRLRAKIVETRRFELAPPDQTTPDGVAIKGLRLEEFGDREKAGRVWDSLISLTEKDADARVWYLLASQQRAQIPKEAGDNSVNHRTGLIKKQLDEARQLAAQVKGDPDKKVERARVRQLCREVIELYDDEPGSAAGEAVTQAKAIMAEVPKS